MIYSRIANTGKKDRYRDGRVMGEPCGGSAMGRRVLNRDPKEVRSKPDRYLDIW